MAVPRPVHRPVYRRRQRLSLGTKFLIVVMLLAIGGSVAAFLAVGLPGQVARLSQIEANDMVAARAGVAGLSSQVVTLWAELSAQGTFSLSSDRFDGLMSTSQKLEKATDDGLAHVQAAQADIDHLLAVPLQPQVPAFVAPDRAALGHLERGLQEGRRLAHAAVLQITVARGLLPNRALIAQLNANLNARNWTQASRTASELQQDLPGRQDALGNPDALIDPLWGAYADAMMAYSTTAQRYALASAAGQSAAAAELGGKLASQSAAIDAALKAARDGAAAWKQKKIQPILELVATELTAGGAKTTS